MLYECHLELYMLVLFVASTHDVSINSYIYVLQVLKELSFAREHALLLIKIRWDSDKIH